MQRYEHDIAQLEAERGNDIRWIKPDAGFVAKTRNQAISTSEKIFVNICSSAEIEKAASKPTAKDGRAGVNWSLPYSLTKSREDVDKRDPIRLYLTMQAAKSAPCLTAFFILIRSRWLLRLRASRIFWCRRRLRESSQIVLPSNSIEVFDFQIILVLTRCRVFGA